MIEFVCTAPIRKNGNTGCHGNHTFHIAQIEFIFLEHFLSYSVGPREKIGINEQLSWGARWVKLDTGVQRQIEYIEIAFAY